MGRNRSLYIGGAIILGLPVLLFIVAAFGVVGVALGWFSLFGVEHPKRELARLEAQYGEEVRGLQALREIKLYEHRERLRIARATLPADAPISQDWDFREALKALGGKYDGELLAALTGAYIHNPYDMLGDTDSGLRNKLESLHTHQDKLTYLEQRFLLPDLDSCDLRAHWEDYLQSLPFLEELEFALFHHVVDLQITNPDLAPEHDPRMPWHIALELMNARIVMYGINDDRERALALLAEMFDLAKRAQEVASLPHAYQVFRLHNRANNVLMLIVPHISWTEERETVISRNLTVELASLAQTLQLAATSPRSAFFSIGGAGDQRYAILRRFRLVDQVVKAFHEDPVEVTAAINRLQVEISDFDMGIQDMLRLIVMGTLDFNYDLLEAAVAVARIPLHAELFTLVLRLDAYHDAHGRYPSALDQLPEPTSKLVDLATGRSVQYVREGQGYRLELPRKDETRSPSVVWEVPASQRCQ
jgi:hypothetical protein